jgi:SNF2 family DNA or RNA helicase
MDYGVKIPLRDYQKEAVDFHIRTKWSINGFKMGLGKTAIAVAWASYFRVPTAVVCPAYLKKTWEREIKKFSRHPELFWITSYSALNSFTTAIYRKENQYRKPQLVIFDEMHYLKTPSTKRTKSAFTLVNRLKPLGVLGLTGTPVKNRVNEWYTLLSLISRGNKDIDMSSWTTYESFGDHFSTRYSIKVPYGYKASWKGVRNTHELANLIKPIYITRKGTKDLPPRVTSFIRLRRAEIKEKMGHYEWLEVERAFNKQASRNSSELKLHNAISKVDGTVAWLKDVIKENEEPLVIFSDHIEPVEKISQQLRRFYSTKAITGKTPMATRQKIVDELNEGKIKAIVATIGSMSTGYSITGANKMVFNDYPWVPGDLAQAEARIRRMNKTDTCFYYYIFSSDMDEKIYKLLESKVRDIKASTEFKSGN